LCVRCSTVLSFDFSFWHFFWYSVS
jgi:hypothetical protein